ncbi:uncharacterized protein LOC134288373 [Aedes albopictus]|uniref:Reverse transcriptase domain-containing protein n=1 Tax=Aedes albopictus TaxID=7160 RepID=A0ABM1ZGS1_AEDAL
MACGKKTAPSLVMCIDREMTDLTMVTARWREYFEELLNGGNGRATDRIRIDDDGQAVEPPTLDEVKTAIRGLKNNNAAGKDELPVQFLKYDSEQLYQLLHRIILTIWEEEELPASWLDVLICPPYKKGHRLECANYRGTTLLNSPYKILPGILFHRLRSIEESSVGQYQAGFREGRSTFTLRQIIDKFREYNLQTHHLFIEFKAAYGSVKRNELWQITIEHGFPVKLIRLVRVTLGSSKSGVWVADEISSLFVALDGLKQGDVLSNLLLNITLERAIRRAGVQRSGPIVTKSHVLLGFADDIDIIGIDRRAVEEAFIPFTRETARIGLMISTTETKYKVVGGQRRVGLAVVLVKKCGARW